MISTSLSGRLRNTKLPLSHSLMPLFEAVVNSIQSIDLMPGGSADGRIDIKIERSGQAFDLEVFGAAPKEPIVGFRIRDNGVGFHDDNLGSFETLDTEYKLSQGCRGVGRLLWLKAFKRVEISSAFETAGEFFSRSFRFVRDGGITELVTAPPEIQPSFAEVYLSGFDRQFQKSSPKKCATIARDLLEHCLWYFVREGGAPAITIADDDEMIDLHELFDGYLRSTSKTDPFTLRGKKFELIHLKLKTSAQAAPTLNWCAANRVVVGEKIAGKISGLYGVLSDSDGEFTYCGYLISPFLDERVRPERTEFDLEESEVDRSDGGDDPEQELILLDKEPSRADIRGAVFHLVEAYLGDSLDVARRRSRERIDAFVKEKAPRYRPVIGRINDKSLGLDPNISDRDLELELHKRFADFEAEVLREGQEVLEDAVLNLTNEEFTKKLDQYLEKVEDVKKSDLAAYVARRRLILDLLAQAIERNPDGRYCREDFIHNLIMPMQSTSNDVKHRASNLWIVDERLAFHDYLASDMPLSAMPITGSTSTKEPDLLALQLCNSPVLVAEGQLREYASLTIVEIKRPMRNDMSEGEKKDPIEQCLRYLERVRRGRVTTASGRPIPGVEEVPGYCYVIADLTSTLEERCRMHDLTRTADRQGYFGYKAAFNAYVEVISFDRLLRIAKQRNRAFFDAVGLPAN